MRCLWLAVNDYSFAIDVFLSRWLFTVDFGAL
jgi:hypothetical protein